MNKERLLNVAKALRESKNPASFTMARVMNHCGTPACAFGHYAARQDLQDVFTINTEPKARFAFEGVHIKASEVPCCYDSKIVLEHFGITDDQVEELFSSCGCEEAKTPIEAAEYIERFVARAE